MENYVGRTEYGVELEPLLFDVQNERSRKASGKFIEDLSNASRDRHGFYVLEKALERAQSKIPIKTLFGDFKCEPGENRLCELTDVQLPPAIAAELNNSQMECVVQAITCKVSITVGPPGTGKSSTLAALIIFLVDVKGEKIAAVAATNVAVDALLSSCIELWRKLYPGTEPPFVQVYSEGMIDKQWEAGEMDKLHSPCHINKLRHDLASQEPKAYGAFFRGYDELVTSGRIADHDLAAKYSADCKKLTPVILEARKAVFATLATSQAPSLYKEDADSGELKRYYPASTIVCDEAGTVTRPLLLVAIMSFVSAKRLTLGGDPNQLGPYIKSQKAKNAWPEIYLKAMVKRNYPSRMLNVQYRMHDRLYAHLPVCVYKGKTINSARLTSDPTPFLRDLLSRPTQATTQDGEAYVLNNFLHFVNVDGVQVKEPNNSSVNAKEAHVVDALVQALISRGIAKAHIGVMTGYKSQRKLLRSLAKEHDWEDIKIIATIDASQGSQFKIVIMSLVSTQGYPHFLGERSRANVGTSRQQEALYFVGQEKFWWTRPMVGGREYNRKVMHDILRFMADSAQEAGESFVINPQRLSASEADDVPEGAEVAADDASKHDNVSESVVPGFDCLATSGREAQSDAEKSFVEKAERDWKVAMEEKDAVVRGMTLEKKRVLEGILDDEERVAEEKQRSRAFKRGRGS
ncbi:MAG: hypothetical protein Q9208_004888 [Pyrenodesmia sp. 3 TL-2023]